MNDAWTDYCDQVLLEAGHPWRPTIINWKMNMIRPVQPWYKKLLNYITERLDMFGIKKMKAKVKLLEQEIEFYKGQVARHHEALYKQASSITDLEAQIKELKELLEQQQNEINENDDELSSRIDNLDTVLRAVLDTEGYAVGYDHDIEKMKSKGYEIIGRMPGHDQRMIWHKKKKG